MGETERQVGHAVNARCLVTQAPPPFMSVGAVVCKQQKLFVAVQIPHYQRIRIDKLFVQPFYNAVLWGFSGELFAMTYIRTQNIFALV